MVPPHTLNSSSCAAFPKANCLLSYCRFPSLLRLCVYASVLAYSLLAQIQTYNSHKLTASAALISITRTSRHTYGIFHIPLLAQPHSRVCSHGCTSVCVYTPSRPSHFVHFCPHSFLGPSCMFYSLKAPTYCPQPLWVCVLHTLIPSCLPPQ